ncbi:MAG: serine/threonine-protein kinase [Kofleriaceae bacterium]
MTECIAEADLFELAHAQRALDDAPVIEAHLADCPSCSALLATLLAAPDEARRDLIGTLLGPYRLDGLVGAGAMGEVYRGWDTRLHRHVAVKVLRHADITRLEREARAAAAIAHPNVVTVYDTGVADGIAFVVSELITGESLHSVIARGRSSEARVGELARELARGLAAAHAQGVVHRDLKPNNLIVAEDGTLKILDFGLALIGDEGERGVVGTSGYLAPEQARGEPADARSDLFSVGAIIYELATGRRAFAGATHAERLESVLHDAPPPLAGALGPIVMRCLDKDPRKRFQSASDLAWVLEAQPAPPAAARSRLSRRAFLTGVTATGAGGLVLGRLLAPARRAAFVPEYRQLTYRQGRVANARFTRDGGTLVYAAVWEDHSSAVFTNRLAGGGIRALELPPAHLLAVSVRGELALSLDHRFIEGFYQRGHLALAPLEGGPPRRLGLEVQEADFTADGAELAIVRPAGTRFRLELPAGTVLHEAGWLSHPRVSPSGDAVACCVHDGPDDDRGDLVLVSRAGVVKPIATGWSSIDGVAWAAGGGGLWISASREGGNNAVWSVPLDGGAPVQVPSVGRLRVHDISRNGTLAVTQTSGRLRTMVKAPGATDEADLSLSDVSLVADIAADGRSFVVAEFGDVDAANGAYLRPTDGGPPLRLGEGVPIDLAEDGRGVLAWRYGSVASLVAFGVPEGQPRSIALPALEGKRWPRWARSGLVVAGAQPGRPARWWRTDPLAAVTDEGVVGFGAVSPAGTSLALISDDRLIVADIAGKAAPRIVPGSFTDRRVCGWASEDEVFVRGASPPIRIERVHATTGATVLVREVVPPPPGVRGIHQVTVSRDGDAYAYSYGQELSRLYTMTTAG